MADGRRTAHAPTPRKKGRLQQPVAAPILYPLGGPKRHETTQRRRDDIGNIGAWYQANGQLGAGDGVGNTCHAVGVVLESGQRRGGAPNNRPQSASSPLAHCAECVGQSPPHLSVKYCVNVVADVNQTLAWR